MAYLYASAAGPLCIAIGESMVSGSLGWRLGTIQGSWGHVGAFRGHFRGSWGHIWGSWLHFVGVCGISGASWGLFWGSWRAFGCSRTHFGGTLGSIEVALGCFRDVFGLLWKHFGATSMVLGGAAAVFRLMYVTVRPHCENLVKH